MSAQSDVRSLLESVRSGETSVDEALLRLKTAPFEDIGCAKVDLHRSLRQGVSEVIYGAGKTPEQILAITDTLLKNGQTRILVTRLEPDTARTVSERYPFDYDACAKTAVLGGFPPPDGAGTVLIATGGTSDLPVAQEAAVTARMLGNEVLLLCDVGVAGLHRLLSHKEDIMRASVVIAVAGMEGAMASVIGGLADCPVIAVPTSVGYGASFGGLSALLSMLNSCAAGVGVVNIDNGFGAAYLASKINHMEAKP